LSLIDPEVGAWDSNESRVPQDESFGRVRGTWAIAIGLKPETCITIVYRKARNRSTPFLRVAIESSYAILNE